MKTPNTQTIVDAVKAEFGDKVTVGAWACRRIAGTLTWSQHSWTEARDGPDFEGNAADIFPINRAVGDQVAAFIRAKFGDIVKTVLWWVKDHFDHVHFDTWPTGIATPPCKGGGLLVKHRDGKVGRHFTDDIAAPPPAPPIPVPIPIPPIPTPPIGDDDMTAAEFASRLSIEQVRAICNRAGEGGVWVISPNSADRAGVTNYFVSILNTPTNADWGPFYQEVQAEALVNAALNP